MARVITYNIVTTADNDHAIDDGDQRIYIAQTALVAAQGFFAHGVNAAGYLDLIVAGQVYSASGYAVYASASGEMSIAGSGLVASGGTAILGTGQFDLYNAGTVDGGSYGVYLNPGSYTAQIINSGTIIGASTAIYVGVTSSFDIVNTGTILGGDYALFSGASLGEDRVINSGTIIGLVSLYGGDDFVDTRNGFIDGRIDAGSGNDILYGSINAANDMVGGFGDDVLQGGDRDDLLNGGVGADELIGGAGTDTAIYSSSGAGFGSLVDLEDNGRNRGDAAGDILASIENLTGGARIDHLYGNSGANLIQGSDGDDILDGRGGNDKLYGGAGTDTMFGGTGNDFFWVNDTTDIVRELANEGNDEVRASVSYSIAGQYIETLTLLGSDAINGTGNTADNKMIGNDAANILTGGQGKDLLTGKGGADQFVMFGALAASNVDTITDFQQGIDDIVLDRTFFTQIGPVGALDPNRFIAGGALDANDRILYNAATGVIFYDADGTGATAAIAFANVMPGTVLDAADFLIIA